MRKSLAGLASIAVLFVCPDAPSSPSVTSGDYAVAYLRFEKNVGQLEPDASFVLRGVSGNVFLTRNGELHFGASRSTMKVLGARDVSARASGELAAYSNYFIGNDSKHWYTHIPTYTRVTFPLIREGIDLVYHCENGQLEYDIVVRPGANAADLSIAFSGVEPELAQLEPRAFVDNRSVPVAARRVDDTLSFDVEPYDPALMLVIDPVIAYSMLLGGHGEDTALGIAADSQGNAFVVGATDSTDFPLVTPIQPTFAGNNDAFVAKLDPLGTLVYATYLGGSDFDLGSVIALDSAGRVHVTGTTTSSNFPTKDALQPTLGGPSDAFVLTLEADGTLAKSTYFGGTGGERGESLAVDPAGTVYVAGTTGSTDLPTKNAFQSSLGGEQDFFVSAFSATDTMIYSTYLGGNSIDGQDFGGGIAVDATSHAYVTGSRRLWISLRRTPFSPPCLVMGTSSLPSWIPTAHSRTRHISAARRPTSQAALRLMRTAMQS